MSGSFTRLSPFYPQQTTSVPLPRKHREAVFSSSLRRVACARPTRGETFSIRPLRKPSSGNRGHARRSRRSGRKFFSRLRVRVRPYAGARAVARSKSAKPHAFSRKRSSDSLDTLGFHDGSGTTGAPSPMTWALARSTAFESGRHRRRRAASTVLLIARSDGDVWCAARACRRRRRKQGRSGYPPGALSVGAVDTRDEGCY